MKNDNYFKIIKNLKILMENPNRDNLIEEMVQSSKKNNNKEPFDELKILLKNPNTKLITELKKLFNSSIDNLFHDMTSWDKDILDKLKNIIEETKKNKTLGEYIQYLVDSRGIPKDSKVYKSANLSRSYWSTLVNDVKTNPSKNKLLRLAIALKLDNYELNELLKKAGYALKDDPRDTILHQLFRDKIYDLELTDEILNKFNLEPLYDTKELSSLGMLKQ